MINTEIKSRINYKKLDIEDHAVQRAIERLKRKDRQDALNYCRALLGQSRYVGETTCERGNHAHMFIAPNKIEIYLNLELTTIRTVITNKDKTYIVYDKDKTMNSNEQNINDGENIFSVVKNIPLQDKLIKLYQIEFKKHDRLEKKMDKEFSEYRLLKNIEIAELSYQIYKCKSTKKRDELIEKAKKIESVLALNLMELKKIQDDKRKIAKALSSLLTS